MKSVKAGDFSFYYRTRASYMFHTPSIEANREKAKQLLLPGMEFLEEEE